MCRYVCVLRRLVEIVRIFSFFVCGKCLVKLVCNARRVEPVGTRCRGVRVCLHVTAVISHAFGFMTFEFQENLIVKVQVNINKLFALT
jgi:hypothetical protein